MTIVGILSQFWNWCPTISWNMKTKFSKNLKYCQCIWILYSNILSLHTYWVTISKTISLGITFQLYQNFHYLTQREGMDVDPKKLSRNISFESNRFDQDYQFQHLWLICIVNGYLDIKFLCLIHDGLIWIELLK